jgi:hypothetical protein
MASVRKDVLVKVDSHAASFTESVMIPKRCIKQWRTEFRVKRVDIEKWLMTRVIPIFNQTYKKIEPDRI